MYKRMLYVILAALFLMVAVSCTKGEKAEDPQPGLQKEAAQPSSESPAEEIIYTAENPGPWSGKNDAHVPQIVYEKTADGCVVTVTVAHEMAPEKPHYIQWIKLQDGKGRLLGEALFQPDDEKAEAVFALTETPSKLVALEKCNLHGVWKAEIDIPVE
jgi:superoxide reductase